MRKALGLTVMLGLMGLSLGSRPVSAFIFCSCTLCSTSNVECRITPSGKSLSCSDYYQLRCGG
jgi:hypothetical protein